MQYTLVREMPGRLRVRLAGHVPPADVEPLRVALEKCPAITKAMVYPRIGSVAVSYAPVTDARALGDGEAASGKAALDAARADALNWIGMLDAAAVDSARKDCAGGFAPRTNDLLMDIAELVGFHYLRRWFLPMPLRTAWTIWSYRRFLWAGLKSLLSGRLDVPVLDAAAVGISFVRGDFTTASSTMFLLNIGEALEDYTKARSQHELIYSLLVAHGGAAERERVVVGDVAGPVVDGDLLDLGASALGTLHHGVGHGLGVAGAAPEHNCQLAHLSSFPMPTRLSGLVRVVGRLSPVVVFGVRPPGSRVRGRPRSRPCRAAPRRRGCTFGSARSTPRHAPASRRPSSCRSRGSPSPRAL